MASHFMFVANDVPRGMSEYTSATEIAETLLNEGFWAFTEAAPLRAKLEEGDRVLIYLAGPTRREFVASAVVGGAAAMVQNGTDEERILSSLGLRFMAYQIRLLNVVRFEQPVKIRPLIDRLQFITEKKNYGLHLRLPIVRISPDDYQVVLDRV